MKIFLLCISACMLTLNASANNSVVVNTNVLNSLTQTNALPSPKFPIMPKRVEKPKTIQVKKPVVKNIVTTAPKPVPTPVIKAPEPSVEQQALQKQFEALPTIQAKNDAIKDSVVMPKAEPTPANPQATHTPKTLELVPGIKVADIPAKTAEEAPKPTTNKENGRIVFDSFEAKLTAKNKTKIDNIVAGFKDPINNKISIIAYNVEDGVDAFKKKRQVLDHALEIRNYLAQKGYNNLSLRVLSVSGDKTKTNLVEISEI